jgi:alkylation response protein AidB-like acyl-CoA dehydrogenase
MADTAEFNEVFLAGARTDASLVVGEVHQGWKVAMSTLEHERGVAMLGYQNKFESEFAAALTAAHERGTIADAPLRHRLVDSFIGLNVMRYLTLRTLTSLLQGGKTGAETSLLKLVWPRWHADLGEIEMDLLGASSEIVGEDFELNPFQTTYLLSRAESIYGGTQQIHLNIVAERLLGLPRDPRPQGR